MCLHVDKYAPSTSRVNFLWWAQICSETSQWLNCYCHSRWTWKWAKLLFLHILDFSNLNSSVILIACGSESSQKHFGLALIRDLIQEAVWDKFQVSRMCSVRPSLKLYYKKCTLEGRLALQWKSQTHELGNSTSVITEHTLFQKHYPEEAVTPHFNVLR